MGPALFNWSADKWRDFYFRIADEAEVESVYIGEVVCAKRAPFYIEQLPEVIERLEAGGKRPVLSTLALVMNRSERESVRQFASERDFTIEVNDISALSHLGERSKPHIIGPNINCYNEETLEWFANNGAFRLCLPVELPIESVRIMAAHGRRIGMEVEMMAYGRMPLAVSARCYHARVHRLSKDSCQFVCGEDADGLPLRTLDREDFLTVNGVQTMSHECLNLLPDLAALAAMGVSVFRLSPQSCDMVAVASLYRQVLDGKMSGEEASRKLAGISFDAPFANGYIHRQPGAKWSNDPL
jgi:collagenase-like PrtC family protease